MSQRRGQVLDAREQFAAKTLSPVKFPAFAPNLQYLRDLCSGLTRTWTTRTPLSDIEDLPAALSRELRQAIDRNTKEVGEVLVSRAGDALSVVFTTKDRADEYTFGFTIPARYVHYAVEKSAHE